MRDLAENDLIFIIILKKCLPFFEIPCGSKISSKSLYLAQFSTHKHFCVCKFTKNFENSKWPPFSERIGMATLQRYTVGEKFCQNRSI